MARVAIAVICLALSVACVGCSNAGSGASSSAEASTSSSSQRVAESEASPKQDVQQPQAEVVEAQPLPSYQEFASTLDESIGAKYHIAGTVTHVSGGFRGDDYMVYVYWDESETNGEVAAVRIPYKRYTSSVNRYFEGDCTLEGTDERGNPQFVCMSYSTERP